MKKLVLSVIVLLLTHLLVQAQEIEAQSAPLRINLVKDTEAPQVFMAYRNEGRVNNNGKVDVEIRVYDGSGIKSLTVNGRERMDGTVRDTVRFNAEFYNDDEIFIRAEDSYNNVRDRNFNIKSHRRRRNFQKWHRAYLQWRKNKRLSWCFCGETW